METTPRSILIIGGGVFGLSTAWACTKRACFDSASITLIDYGDEDLPPQDTASVDSSRIIRPDYADPLTSAFAAEAQNEWRKQKDYQLGGQQRYVESGFLLTAYNSSDITSGKKTGMEYVTESCKNVMQVIYDDDGRRTSNVHILHTAEALRKCIGTGGHPGDWGYLNKTSGWADARRAMTWLYDRVKATKRVQFVASRVQELVTKGENVIGAKLDDESMIKADVIIVAAGAWTGTLVDLRGRVEATGHALGYMDISEAEAEVLRKQPVVLNLTSGLFAIPPQDRELKIARHTFGYINPQPILNSLPLSHDLPRKPFLASRPWTARDDGGPGLPSEADKHLRSALKDLIPITGLESRPWKATRICWYADTRDGDWLVDWHPGWKSLFIATGDSGHGFKFLPVLGDKVIDCMLGQGGELGKKWRWKNIGDEGLGQEIDGRYRCLKTEDGSRGGSLDMILSEELKKDVKI